MALLEPGHQVARYEVLGRIAVGGMSEVYLARQSGPGGFTKTVVLKVILPNLADDANFVRMFSNEAKLAALLNHPNVVQIFDFGVDDDIHFMAMEYIDGRNLNHVARALKDADQRMPVAVALRVIADACGALEYAHSLADSDGSPLDVIHRDVSLENVLVTYGGQIKLLDFGVAKARNLESYTQVGTLKGKYAYMAPEMVEGKALDSRADLFSMGVVMYQLLTGEQPFFGVNHAMILHQIAYEAPRSPRELVPDLDVELERIVMRALEKSPDVRYGRAAEIQADVEHFMRRSGEALTSQQLAEFMQQLFPPGTDPTRETYRELCGTGAGTPSGGARTGPATPSLQAPRSPSAWLPDEVLATREVASVPLSERPAAMPEVPDDFIGRAESDADALSDDFDGPTRISFGSQDDPAHDTDPYNERYEKGAARAPLLLDQPDSRPTIVPGELQAVTRQPPSGGGLRPPNTLEGGFGLAPRAEVSPAQIDTSPMPASEPSFEPSFEPGFEPSFEPNIPRTVPPSAEIMAAHPLAAPSTMQSHVTSPPLSLDSQQVHGPVRDRRRFYFFGALALGVFLIAGMVVYLVASPDDPAADGTGIGTAAAGSAARGSASASASAGTGHAGSTAGSSAGSAGGSGSAALAPPADASTAKVVAKGAAADAGAVKAVKADAARASAPDTGPVASTKVAKVVKVGHGSGSTRRQPRRHPRRKPRGGGGLLSVLALGSATVYIDGKRHGALPLRTLKLELGTHRVEIRGSAPRYRVVRKVTITRGRHERLRVVPKKGTLLVRVRPWALVTLDGRRLGTTPLRPIKLFEGPHVIVLENDTIGARAGRRIVIKAGQEKVLKVRLVPRKKRGQP